MKKPILTVALASLGLAGAAQAQWQTATHALKGGWNAIYLHGDATHASLETLFASGDAVNVQEVWRWNPNPNQVQFTATPLLPTSGTPEWSRWVRGGAGNTLTQLTGQNAYLVKCAGTTASNWAVPLAFRPLPPATTWVRNGANLLGFPTAISGSTYPLFSTYFATFPAAIAANTKVFKYIGGDLGTLNPQQIFSPGIEQVDRNKAYWFSSEVVGNFYAPIQITFSNAGGLQFGRTGSIITARVMNRTGAVLPLTITPVVSNAAPAGQEPITGQVPVTRRTFDAGTAQWTETPITIAYNEVIEPGATVELSFGINRAAMAGAANALYASLLRFTTTPASFDILIPATARKTSLAGLWSGEAFVDAVESKAQADAITPTGRGFPLRYLLHVADDGTARVLSQIFLGQQVAAPHDFGICTRETGLKADTKAKASRIVATHMPLDRVLDGLADAAEPAGSGSVAIPGTLTRRILLPFNDPTNPFVHQYHPDHDNIDPKGQPLVAGIESYTVTRDVTFTFTTTPPAGSTVTSGWGSSVIGGTYAETVHGLHRDSAGVGTGNGLRLTGTFELQRVSELGSINLTPP
jgi:hypothetical protein